MNNQKSGIKTNGYNSSRLWARREKRSIEAGKRQATHDALTPKQKLEKATKAGGKREIARLQKILS